MNENLGLYNLIYLDSQNPKDPNGASDFQYLGTLVCSLKSPTLWCLKSNPEDPNGASASHCFRTLVHSLKNPTLWSLKSKFTRSKWGLRLSVSSYFGTFTKNSYITEPQIVGASTDTFFRRCKKRWILIKFV